MQGSNLGQSGPGVSALRPGAMIFGSPTAAATTARIIGQATEAMSCFIGTAGVYAGGAGALTEEHWADYIGALDYCFARDNEDAVDGLVPSGHPSTPGCSYPADPVEGRVPWDVPRA